MRYLVLAAIVAAGILYGCGHAADDPAQLAAKPAHEPAVMPAKGE